MTENLHTSPHRAKLHEIIFEADTPGGKAFDVALLVFILASVIAIMLESVAPVRQEYGAALRAFEWTVTLSSPWNMCFGSTAWEDRWLTRSASTASSTFLPSFPPI